MAWPRFRLTGLRPFTLWTALVLLAFLGVSFAMLYISQKDSVARGAVIDVVDIALARKYGVSSLPLSR